MVVLLYFVLVLFLVPKAGGYLLKMLDEGQDGLITCFIFVVLVTVLIGEFLGINLVVGAFLAGLGLSRVVKSAGETFRKFEGIGYGFLIPFLFISIGMKTDLRMLFQSAGNLQIILLTVVGLVGSKVFSGWLALRLCGFSNVKGICAGVMTVPQLSATLAAAAIGKELGMLDNNFFNAIVVLSIVTTLPVPNLVRWIIEHYQLKFPAPRTQDEAFRITEEQDDLL
ncbi:MAG: cation:proton antiporter [Victivallales bacterium]